MLIRRLHNVAHLRRGAVAGEAGASIPGLLFGPAEVRLSQTPAGSDFDRLESQPQWSLPLCECPMIPSSPPGRVSLRQQGVYEQVHPETYPKFQKQLETEVDILLSDETCSNCPPAIAEHCPRLDGRCILYVEGATR